MSINCGHCHSTHPTVADVRACSGVTRVWTELGHSADYYAGSRARNCGGPGGSPRQDELDFNDYRDPDAWAWADEARRDADRAPQQRWDRAATATRPARVELEDGIYLYEGNVYKVYHTVHGANQQVAKILRPSEVADVKGEWEYMGKRGLQGIRPEHRITREQALEFGSLYGICCRCGAVLTREESIDRAMGPVCYGKMGW